MMEKLEMEEEEGDEEKEYGVACVEVWCYWCVVLMTSDDVDV